MDVEKLIEQLRKSADFEDYPIVASFAAIIEKKYLRDAATALSTLQDENESLKEKLYDGEGVNLVDYWMQQAKIEENGHRNCQAENEKLRAELERVKRERDAAIKELDEVTSEVDDLAEFVDREIHPVVDYNLYLDLRENVDAVSMFQHEDEWRGLHKEE